MVIKHHGLNLKCPTKAHVLHHSNAQRQGFGGAIDHMDLLMSSIHNVMRCQDYEVMDTEEAVLT